MAKGIKDLKPGVSPRVHVACAAGLWSGIGLFLLWRSFSLLKSVDKEWLIGAGIVLGSAKSVFILDRVCRTGIERIRRFSDNTCIGAVYSWKTWLLVLAMMLMGFFVRQLAIAPFLLGTILAAVGWALLWSSRHAWIAWLRWDG